MAKRNNFNDLLSRTQVSVGATAVEARLKRGFSRRAKR